MKIEKLQKKIFYRKTKVQTQKKVFVTTKTNKLNLKRN